MIKPAAARRHLPSSDHRAELDCFLQVEGATGADAEEVALALADELEDFAQSASAEVAKEARETSKELRLFGFLVNAELGGDRPRMVEQLEELATRANDLIAPPVVSGVRRRITPAAPMPLASLYGADDEERTAVRSWMPGKSTNRVLAGEDLPPSSRKK